MRPFFSTHKLGLSVAVIPTMLGGGPEARLIRDKGIPEEVTLRNPIEAKRSLPIGQNRVQSGLLSLGGLARHPAI